MGLFNTLRVDDESGGTVQIQFKYGECWMHEYRIGDSGAVVETDAEEFRDILVQNNKIIGVRDHERSDFPDPNREYRVIS
jgi:hypothetical protein